MSDTFDFNEQQYQNFMKRLEQDFIISLIDEVSGGLSGARTFVVRIRPRNPANTAIEDGWYILKVSHREEAVQELKNYKVVKGNPILTGYVLDLIEPPLSYQDTDTAFTGLLYQIAGEYLLPGTTLRKRLEEPYFRSSQQMERLAGVVLRWNFEATHIDRISDLLESILQGFGEQHLKELEESLKGIGQHLDRSRINLTPLADAAMYNPIYFLRNRAMDANTSLRQMAYSLPRGQLHGDLHPDNVIVPREDLSKESFHIIDFASTRPGNVFFDLAYLEISTLLNSRGGFHKMFDLLDWWDLEKLLVSGPLPSIEEFPVGLIQELLHVLPIRRALDARIKQDGKKVGTDYWVAFLAASVEAGLDLARKTYHDRSMQRVAFLTAVSRFDHLVRSLDAFKTPILGPMASIYWPGEAPSSMERGEKKEAVTPPSSTLPDTEERQQEFKSLWPGAISQRPVRPSLFAIARAGLEEDDSAFIGKTYSVLAGVSQIKPKGFSWEPLDLPAPSPAEPIEFDILLHASENVELATEWFQRLRYDPGNPQPQLVEFLFRSLAPGHGSLAVNFYRERHWLKTIRFEFDVVEQSKLASLKRL